MAHPSLAAWSGEVAGRRRNGGWSGRYCDGPHRRPGQKRCVREPGKSFASRVRTHHHTKTRRAHIQPLRPVYRKARTTACCAARNRCSHLHNGSGGGSGDTRTAFCQSRSWQQRCATERARPSRPARRHCRPRTR